METTPEERERWLAESYALLSEEPSVELMAEAWSRVGALIRDVNAAEEALRPLYELCELEGDEDGVMEEGMWITVDVPGGAVAKARAVLAPKEASRA